MLLTQYTVHEIKSSRWMFSTTKRSFTIGCDEKCSWTVTFGILFFFIIISSSQLIGVWIHQHWNACLHTWKYMATYYSDSDTFNTRSLFFAVSFAREWHNMKWLINIYAFLLHAHWTPIRFYYATGKYYYMLHATRKKFCDFFFFRWNCYSRMANFRCNTKSRERVCYAINNTWFIYFFHFWPFRSNFTNAC